MSRLDYLISQFIAPENDVGVFREDQVGSEAYWMFLNLGDDFFWCIQLLEINRATGGVATTIHSLNKSQIRKDGLGTANIETLLLDEASVYEFAIRYVPDPAINDYWIGNGHGLEDEISLAITVDDVVIVLADGGSQAGSIVEITRISEFFHPEIGGGTTPVGEVNLLYRINRYGLTVDYDVEFLFDGNIVTTAYTAMYPIGNDIFSKGSNVNSLADVSLDNSDGSVNVNQQSKFVYAWDADGKYGTMMYVPNLIKAVNSFKESNGLEYWIEDALAGGRNKMYLTRINGAVTPIDANTIWQVFSNRAVMRFDDPDKILKRYSYEDGADESSNLIEGSQQEHLVTVPDFGSTIDQTHSPWRN